MPPDELLPGARLGAYRIVRALGRGGMGVVYEALEEGGAGRAVAIKVLAPGLVRSEALMERVRREERALRAIKHRNVVEVIFVGEERGRRFLVLELLPGGTLEERLRRGPLPWREAARLGAQIARALGAVHAAGLVHRDLKPSNVLLDAQGNAKLTDFGVVRPEGESLAESIEALTRTGDLIGTFEYMSPEQAEGGRGPVDGRSDLYSLGATLHALLTGRPPFEGTGFAAVTAHLMQPPRPPSWALKGIPDELDALVLELLAKKKDDRPASALDVARRLDVLAGGSGGGARGTRRAILVASACALLVSVAVVAATTRKRPPPPPEPQPSGQPAVPPPPPAPPKPRRRLLPREEVPHLDRSRLREQQHRRWIGNHAGKVMGSAFSPDGKLLVTGSARQEIFVWNPSPSTDDFQVAPIHRLPGHDKVTWCVAFTPDGRRLVTAGYDGKVITWDTVDWRHLAEMPAQDGSPEISGLAVSREDPPRVVIGTSRGNLEVYDMDASGKLSLEKAIKAHEAKIDCVVFLPDQKRVLSGGGDGLLETDLDSGETHMLYPAIGPSLVSIAVSPDARTIMWANWGQPWVQVGDLDKRPPAALDGHVNVVRSLAISPDGTMAATGSLDHSIRLWDTRTWQEIVQTIDYRVPVGTLAFSPDGRQLVAGAEEWGENSDHLDVGIGCVSLWDLYDR